jgi:hypothetical protein
MCLCMRSSSVESVIVTEFQPAEAYSSLELAIAKYSISRLYKGENENIIVRIDSSSFIVCEK